ncbi:MAG: bifunctional precorrin-2 dehydrogenase/sirohydrochlorin ferrochelatase [Clostridiales Family XIII bacterium]|jgi:siroheme synthase-like protein|nr:bifunctional precorrin-2 dehydrogenase/sirohydrochlorin ferrochelatase [Clostridiales Family XIII bacterium]
MPYFPLFVNIEGRRCVVVGGGAVAVRKAAALLEYGAKVEVIAPSPSSGMEALVQGGGAGIVRRAYGGGGDIRGAAMVVSASGDAAVDAAVARDSNELGIPVNVADAPALCSFYFPAVVRRGEISVGVSTSGSCPRLAGRIRAWMESRLPEWLAGLPARLGPERARLIASGLPEDEIVRLLDIKIDAAFDEAGLL